jgi:outer membrane protein assembly factor BamD (BamD/ComL family)
LQCLFLFALIGYGTLGAQAPPATQKPSEQQPPDETNPPEEDESVAPKKYVLNPLEAERNVKVGDFYWNKKDYVGALSRYRDATHYNPSSAEAFFKVAEAEEKLHNPVAAKAAFQKVINLAPDSKFAAAAKKKLGNIKG